MDKFQPKGPSQDDHQKNNQSHQKVHGIHPRQMGRTMGRSMGRSMNRLGTPAPKAVGQKTSTTTSQSSELTNNNLLSTPKEMPAERVIPEVQESVGIGGVNCKEDVEIVQYYLQEAGLLTELDIIPEDAGAALEEAQLPNLIAAIYTFQEEVLHWQKTDGNIGGPESKTLLSLKAATPELVKSQMEEYPAIKAKREAQAAAEAKAEAELKEKQEKAAATLKAKQAAEKKEKERIEQLKGESDSPENAQKFISEYPKKLALANRMSEFVTYKPGLVNAVLNELGRTERDNLTFALMNRLSDSELANTDRELLVSMKSSLEAWFVSYNSGEYKKSIQRLDNILGKTGQKNEVKSEKLSPMAEELQKQINEGKDNKLKERLLELSSYVREQLEVYPPKVKAFKEQSNYTADEKVKVLGEIAFEAAKMEFLIGSTFYEKGEKWETHNHGDFVDVYTKKANYKNKKGEEVKSTAPWCAKFVGFIYNTVLGSHAINSNDPVRGFWGGSQISGGYENFFDYEEEEGGRFVGQKNVNETSPWKDLRIELKEKSTKAEKKELVLDFFETHFSPQKGDIMITSRTRNNSFQASKHVNFDTSHTTMVEKVDTSGEDVFLYTIEGNAGDKVTGKRYDLLKTTGHESLASVVNISRMSLNNHGKSTELRSQEEITTEKDNLGNHAVFTEEELIKPLLEMNNILIDLSFELNGIGKKKGTIYDIKFLNEENNKVD